MPLHCYNLEILADCDEFTLAYIECALWASTQDDGRPMDDDFTADDLAPETLAKMMADCADFQRRAGRFITDENYVGDAECTAAEYAGHDFWLTRNGHGAGFWDGDWADSDVLDQTAESFGETDLYLGDDGLIYAS